MNRSNRRKQSRLSKRVPIRFGPDYPSHLGFSRNLSLDGLEIVSRIAFNPQTTLHLEVAPERETFKLEGIVCWSSTDIPNLKLRLNQSMGLELINNHRDYENYIVECVGSFSEQRHEPRFSQVFKVIFKSTAEVLEKYTRDISNGGLFVASAEVPQLNTLVDVQIVVPDPMRIIHCIGRVVHIIDAPTAEKFLLDPGFGIQFVQFFGNDRQVLDAYIMELRNLLLDR